MSIDLPGVNNVAIWAHHAYKRQMRKTLDQLGILPDVLMAIIGDYGLLNLDEHIMTVIGEQTLSSSWTSCARSGGRQLHVFTSIFIVEAPMGWVRVHIAVRGLCGDDEKTKKIHVSNLAHRFDRHSLAGYIGNMISNDIGLPFIDALIIIIASEAIAADLCAKYVVMAATP